MAKAVKCWGNPFIKVNLTTGAFTEEHIKKKLRKKFLLGRGTSDWLIFNSIDPRAVDPLGPDNVIIFSSGLLSDTSFPGASRTSVVSLNPLTKGYGESSNAGPLAIELKRAGYDGVIISGRSPVLAYLWINDGHIELKPANHLAGKTTFETSAAIKRELGDPSVKTACIGPAGEKLVRFANVNCENRYSGRCGMGAVMGAKNLKAIAVRGTGSVELADPESFKQISRKIRKALTADPIMRFHAARGQAATPEAYMDAGINGVRNFREAYWDGIAGIGYNAVKKYYKGVVHCSTGCPVQCDRLVQIDDGDPYGGTTVNSMQATPAFNFAHFMVDDINTVIKGFDLCNAYGIDIHSWSNVMQWAIECYERGILTREHTDKLDLRWADGPLLLESIKRIALRQGKLGDLLADGVARASAKTGRGSEQYAVQMKGMEIDDELRVCRGYGLGVLVEPRGPTHTLGSWFGEFDATMTPDKAKDLYGTENAANPHVLQDKPELCLLTQRYGAIQDCLGVCLFSTPRVSPQMIGEYNMKTYADLITAATGWEVSENELFTIADRILNVEKSINVLAGLSRTDDYPPEQFFQPLDGERFNGWRLDRREVTEAISRHDELHGWDPETGVPTRQTLESLDLKMVADKLAAAGKI